VSVDLVVLGNPPPAHTAAIERALFENTFFAVVLDKAAIDNPTSIEKITEIFPKKSIAPFDLFLLLSESLSNAVTYGNIETLGLSARQRGSVFLLTLYHIPSIDSKVDEFVVKARKGWLPDLEKDPPNGLGFPILTRLTNKITISQDRTRLQLWISIKKKD
jgi:anti-sigma regulatory factor (Ser/Thr protein kinase)